MDKENKYTVEKVTDGSRWSMCFKPDLTEAHSYIGSSEHWRITDRKTDTVVEKSKGELPSIFDKGKDPLKETNKTYTHTEVRKTK